MYKRLAASAAIFLSLSGTETFAQTGAAGAPQIYENEWFTDFGPVSALDMVERVPSFTIDDGATVRGLSGSNGNVLLNGQYPSTKSNSLRTILSRISAADVERVEFLRASTNEIDLRGQSRAVNIVLRGGGSGSTSYDLLVERRSDNRYSPQLEATHTRFVGATTYAVTAGLHFDHNPWTGTETIRDANGEVLEQRDFADKWNYYEVSGDGVIEHRFGQNLVRASLALEAWEFRRPGHWQVSLPNSNGDLEFAHANTSFTDRETVNTEFNADLERAHTDRLSSELTLLISTRDYRDRSTRTPGAPEALDSESALRRLQLEQIARYTARWSAITGHALQAGVELAYNERDQEFSLCQHDGASCVEVDLPGSNAVVSEDRAEFFMADVWEIAPTLTTELRLAHESSTIAVDGPGARSQDFSFLKPSASLTWNSGASSTWRAGIERQVGQLNFADFISIVDFNQNSTNGGNPDLAPEHFWRAELAYEHQWSNGASLSTTVSYDQIEDVIDRVPVFDGSLDAPGNIGDGTRWQVSAEGTLPLDQFWLENGRLDFSATYTDSEITDPLTGETRRISGQDPHSYTVSVRQDLPEHQLSWWIQAARVGDPVEYRLTEIREQENQTLWAAYIESRHLSAGTVRLGVEHAFDRARDRLVTYGRPDVERSERRRSRQGARLYLQLRGTF